YKPGLSGAAATDNVLVTASLSGSAGGGQTINSLVMHSDEETTTGTPSTISGGPLNITSGVVLSTAQGNTVNSNINVGSAEALFHVYSGNTAPSGTDGLIVNGAISGTGGLTKSGPGHLYLNGANTYTGETVLNH